MAAVDHAARLARINRQLRSEPEEHRTLERIVELAVGTVPGCDFCGVSLRLRGGRVETPASTSPVVDEADGLQYDLGEGPCLDALRAQDTYLVPDLTTETRWPRWAPKAAALGIGSILSIRLATEAHTLGGLNLYAASPHAFDEDDVDVARLYADHAGVALEAAQVVTGLRTALQTRQEIGAAQGILMQRYGVSMEQAFDMLRRHSQDHNVKLRRVAHAVVETVALPAALHPHAGVDELLDSRPDSSTASNDRVR